MVKLVIDTQLFSTFLLLYRKVISWSFPLYLMKDKFILFMVKTKPYILVHETYDKLYFEYSKWELYLMKAIFSLKRFRKV